ncbi:hypothetical protein A3G56_03450 [Candidatus Falkowbacteria bacterium RIFCSPLOWO2_12_FULL_45_10]|uniref:Uncharacterized protein n=3 Tax=Candidatus Falkowiibacteriota TaxID=1752728 RepID=A0A1F5RNC7_9BACT|nr:MAG: hypothetical protein A3D54_00295 [Candidatus Falkowbacteria bacterium RIFCSPHIGHO2_02_FULL_45_15]OGF18534.1 MAG: hypothetical protein A3G56_03450 [Candidatus Falkowbacteria bacterium RIFCSPLOWO2_12_FULL_45_10]OGF19963.1 MAG: hypothetical protein A3I35_04175 [Candidatus Falkowbacteria bacterium RIFCSPLOWO2_02_FULL_45_15]
MTFIHKELSQGRWQQLSLAEQIGNIGAELARAKSWERKNMVKQKNQALARALELIDLTLESVNRPSQLKEITRLREVVAGLFVGSAEVYASLADLEKIYLPFAILAKR